MLQSNSRKKYTKFSKFSYVPALFTNLVGVYVQRGDMLEAHNCPHGHMPAIDREVRIGDPQPEQNGEQLADGYMRT